MNDLMAGATSGFLMASVFICVVMLMLFFRLKYSLSGLQPLSLSTSPFTVTMSVVALAYPSWGVVGVIMGFLYKISVQQMPGGGLGSPNMTFTLGVLLVAIAMAAPFMILLRRVFVGVVVITLMFIGIFGWFFPYMAS